ncbi:hypothetical protein EU527_03375 [Candidatus Thorarchaeota archaeon]|nr:MAG: hypothetical protein EU527_03375 [Candidatus Thorarchaeota archaeon]
MDLEKTKLIGILIIAIIIAGASLIGLVFLQPQSQEQDNQIYYVTVVGVDGTATNVTLADLLSMTAVSRNGSYQNTYGNIRGEGIYTGVKVSNLIDLVGGMEDDESIRVISKDDYSQIFEYAKVYPNQSYWDVQGDMVLAYEYEGLTVPDYEDGFRLTFLPEDGYYSNADANTTTNPDPAAAGPQWVSNVIRIEVLQNLFNTTIELSESELRLLPATHGEGGYKKKSGEIIGPFNYTGVKISYLLEQILDLPENYIVIARSVDGHSIEYTKTIVYGELSGYTPIGDPLEKIYSTMIVAYEQDGEPMIEDGPLLILFLNEDGNLTDGFRWLKDALSLTVLEIASQSPTSYSNNSGSVLSFPIDIRISTETKFE